MIIHTDFDHAPDAQELLIAVRQIARRHGKPLSRPQPIMASERKANTDAQTLKLLCAALALHEPRLADFLDAYVECARLEITGPGCDLRGAHDELMKAAAVIADEFDGAADWLDGPEAA